MDIETQDLNLYLKAIDAQAKVQICVRHVPEVGQLLVRRLSDWTTHHQAALIRGAQDVERRGLDNPPGSAHRFAAMGAQILESLPADDRARRCDELLDSLAIPVDK